jgi:hypothetical protein
MSFRDDRRPKERVAITGRRAGGSAMTSTTGTAIQSRLIPSCRCKTHQPKSTPRRPATSLTVRPSEITSNTAWYRCSATLISLVAASMRSSETDQPKSVGQINRRCGTHQPKAMGQISRTRTVPNRGGEDRTLDTLLKRQVLYH